MNTINILNGVTLASRDEITDHVENATVHLTEEERTAWNAKANASQLNSKVEASTFTAHETDMTVHVSQEEKEKWNARNTRGVVTATQDGLDEHVENTTVHVTEEERMAWKSSAEWTSTVGKVMKMNASREPSRVASLVSQEGLALGAGAQVRATGAGWAMGMDAVCDCNQMSLALGHQACVTGDYTIAVGVRAACGGDSTMVISAYNIDVQKNAALGLEVDNSGTGYLWVASFDHLEGAYSPGVRISLTKFMDLLRSNGGEDYTPTGQGHGYGD